MALEIWRPGQTYGNMVFEAYLLFGLLSVGTQVLSRLQCSASGASNEGPRRSNYECCLCSWLVSDAVWASILSIQRFVQVQAAPICTSPISSQFHLC